MPASPPYIPARDADFDNWCLNFAILLVAAPATYGLLPADAVAVDATVTDWSDSYALALGGTTRGPFSIAAKDTQRVITTAIIRPYAQSIANNAGVLTANKVAIGVNPRTNTPSPIAVPATNPILSVVAATQLAHTLRSRDELSSPSVKAKPYGVMQLYLYGTASATSITNPETLAFIGGFTKSPTIVQWSGTDANKIAYYAGRWANRTGLVGPWSPIVSFTIASGSM